MSRLLFFGREIMTVSWKFTVSRRNSSLSQYFSVFPSLSQSYDCAGSDRVIFEQLSPSPKDDLLSPFAPKV